MMLTGKPGKSSSAAIGLKIAGFVKFTFIGYFTIGLALGVLPVFIHQRLGYSVMVAGIVISLQYVTTFLFRGYAGTIVDKKGPKPTVVLGMAGFAMSGVLLFVAYLLRDYSALSLVLLVATRFMAGFGEGLIGASPISWAILAVGDKYTSKAISYNGIASYGSLSLGAPIGIILQTHFGIGSIGILTLLVGAVGFVYAKNTKALKGASKAPAESFLKVLKTVTPLGICLTLGGLGFGTISTFITLYYAYLKWDNAVLCVSAFSLFFILGRLLFVNLIAVYGGIRAAAACLAVEAAGLLMLWLANTPNIALAGAGVAGLGFSLVFPALGTEAVKLVPASNQGAALGSYGLFADLALGLTGPLIGGVASHFGIIYIFPFSMSLVFTGCVWTILIYIRQKSKYPIV
jgi:MFS family permease